MSLPSYAANRPSFPEIYERVLVTPLFRPFAEQLLARAHLAKDDRLLDVASGTGIVARVAADTIGAESVVGVDVSPPMLAVARSVAPAIDWREGNAASLPLKDAEQFTLVTCHQGLQFMPDRLAAAREIRRALAPGGRVAVATWLSLDRLPFFYELHREATGLIGKVVDQRHAFGGADALAALFTEAGFSDVVVEEITLPIRFADGQTFARMNAMALVGMSEAGKGLSDPMKEETANLIAANSSHVLARYADGKGIAFDLGTNLLTARA